MKTIKVEVEIDEPEKKDFGSQWKDGKTMVFLKPTHPFFWGRWESHRPIDIATAAGSNGKVYVWKGREEIILCSDMGGNSIFDVGTKHLTFNEFNSMTIGTSGSGIFNFRQIEWNVNWQIIDLE